MTGVFIGSTSKDLVNYRQVAINACQDMSLRPIAMEHFEAMGVGACEGSKRKLDEADVYVGIFAYRYGYEEAGYDRSVTEVEFDHAGDLGLDRLCFLVEPEYTWPDKFKDTGEKAKKLAAFKQRIDNTLIRAQFTTVSDFKAKLVQALHHWLVRRLPRPGALSAILAETPDEVPAQPDKLIGRDDPLGEVGERLDRGERVLLQGFGGMGKTALAASLAAGRVEAGRGPVLWLRAGSEDAGGLFEALVRPLDAEAAKAMAAMADEAQVITVRALLKGRGVRLVVLDDAWNGGALARAVKAVPEGMALLVTSRHRYPDFQRVDVGKLARPAAVELLAHHAGADLSGDPDAGSLCETLGDNAFAVRLAGMNLAVDGQKPGELLARIKEKPHDLEAPLDFAEEGHESVNALLETSLEPLDAETRAVFMAFGAFFSTRTTAEMLGLYLGRDQEEVAGGLRELARRGLAERAAAGGEEVPAYGVHDLAYSYARAAAEAVWGRTVEACRAYAGRYNTPTLETFAALRAELDNLLGAAAWAMAAGRYQDVEGLAWDLYLNSEFLDRQGLYAQAVGLLERAAEAAKKRGDLSEQRYRKLERAASRDLRRCELDFYKQVLDIARETGDKQYHQAILDCLGNAHADMWWGQWNSSGTWSIRTWEYFREHKKVIEYFEQVLAFARETGDRRGERNALGILGRFYCMMGREEAIEYFEQALVISRETGDRRGEGSDLSNLGRAYRDLRDYRRAIDYFEQALVVSREISDQQGEGDRLIDLGNAYRSLGDYQRAIDYFEQALAFAREIGDQGGERNALGILERTYRSLGEYQKAIEYHEQELVIARETGNRRWEGNCLGDLGSAYHSLGEYKRAIDYYEQALVVSREISDQQGEGDRLIDLGSAHAGLGEYKKAIEYFEQALVISRESGYQWREMDALGRLGIVYFSLGEYKKAIEYFEQALVISREAGDQSREMDALGRLGIVYFSLGEYKKAIEYHEGALAIARKMGKGFLLPDEGKHLNNLGVAYEAQGDYERAIDYYEQAHAVFLVHGPAHMVEQVERSIAIARRAGG